MLVALVLAMAAAATYLLLSKRAAGRVDWYRRAIRRLVRVPSGTVFTTLNYPAERASPLHVVVVPGNPGVVEFYERFSAALHDELDRAVHITVVSHAGHAKGVPGPRRLFNFQDQVRHKQEFLQALLAGSVQVLHSSGARDDLADLRAHARAGAAAGAPPPSPSPSPRLVLMGHSIGAYMCTQALQALPPEAVAQAHLLAPTLLHIGQTPNGLRLTPAFRRLRWLAAAAAGALGALPAALRRWLASWHVGRDACALDGVEQLCCPHVVRNSLWMALHEMEELRELDEAPLRAHAHKIKGVFAHKDGWVPDEHRELLRRRFGHIIDWHVADDPAVSHAFVLTAPDAVARKCAEWIAELGVPHTPRLGGEAARAGDR